MCEWSARPAFIDGERAAAGLSRRAADRAALSSPHRAVLARRLRRGARAAVASPAMPFALTAIAADNQRRCACSAPGCPACRPIVRSARSPPSRCARGAPAPPASRVEPAHAGRSAGDRGLPRAGLSAAISSRRSGVRAICSTALSGTAAGGFSDRPARTGHRRLRRAVGSARLQADRGARLRRPARDGCGRSPISPLRCCGMPRLPAIGEPLRADLSVASRGRE